MTPERADENRLHMADFDYDLPEDLIAQVPLAERTASRLLVLNRATGSITHSHFTDLPNWIRPNDLLVFNDSRVIPARLRIRRESGGRGELLLLSRDQASGSWVALGRPAKRLRQGETVVVEAGDWGESTDGSALILGRDDSGLIQVVLDQDVEQRLDDFGSVPLPPYITEELHDPERYQTVYGRDSGSAAAPTAGLHFSPAMLEQLRRAGVVERFVTLHVGLDTFRPVTADYADEHAIHTEWCSVSQDVIDAIAACKTAGGRVVAVGTTSARTLETYGQRAANGNADPYQGPTGIYITPGYRWTVVDAMITNFHLPRSTLMLMVSALAGRQAIMRAYREAIAERYRFFSFGDSMLII